MPTPAELIEQGSKQIAQINAIVRSQDAKIKELTKIIDEQVETITKLNEQLNTK